MRDVEVGCEEDRRRDEGRNLWLERLDSPGNNKIRGLSVLSRKSGPSGTTSAKVPSGPQETSGTISPKGTCPAGASERSGPQGTQGSSELPGPQVTPGTPALSGNSWSSEPSGPAGPLGIPVLPGEAGQRQ